MIYCGVVRCTVIYCGMWGVTKMQCSVLRSFAVMGENKNDDKMVLSVFIGYTHTHTHFTHSAQVAKWVHPV